MNDLVLVSTDQERSLRLVEKFLAWTFNVNIYPNFGYLYSIVEMEDAGIFRESEGFTCDIISQGGSRGTVWKMIDLFMVPGSGGGILLPETSVSGLAILLL